VNRKEEEMATLAEIEMMCRDYALARSALKEKVEALNEEIERLKRQRLPQIRKAVEMAAERQNALRTAVSESPELFQKPKTQIFHGIEIGFRKGKGQLVWEDEEQVVRLIHKYYPEEYETYLKITERPIKTALAQLSVNELRRLGVTVIETGDEVIIKATDTEIDRLVNSLLKDEIKEAKEAA